MTKDELEKISGVVDVLLGMPPQRRAAVLDALFPNKSDDAARAEVERLLGDDSRLEKQLAAFSHDAPSGVASAAAETSNVSPDAPTTPPPHAVDAPTKIGRYHIRSRLGGGGMGEVFLAEQLSPIHRRVAIKLIKAGIDTHDVIARFNAERQALARMDHPNIAKVLDAGATETGRPYFVMEYVAGGPITEFADEQRLTIRQRLELFAQVCDAVAHAHTKGVIHRDLKPSNVLAYAEDGQSRIKVIDFGIAKALGSDPLSSATYFTSVGAVLGTYEYMSPEQAGGSADVDTRSDVYSLGVLLYELLAGVRPFERSELAKRADEELRRVIREVEAPRPSTRVRSLQSETAAMPVDSSVDTKSQRIARARYTEPNTLARTLARELEWIPLKALRKETSRRYAGPAELAVDVRNYLAGLPLIAAPESQSYKARKFIARHRAALAAAAVVVGLLIAGTVFYVQRIRTEQRRTLEALNEADRQRKEAAAQRDAATSSEAVATAVSDFQAKMLEAADPLYGRGDKVTVVEMLQSAAEQLQAGGLQNQPLAKARVEYIIGTTYWSLARYAAAEPLLVSALAAHERELPSADVQIDDDLASLGELYKSQRRYAEAIGVYRRGVDRAIRFRGASSWETLLARTRLVTPLVDFGQLEEAERVHTQAAIDIAKNPAMDDNCRRELAGTGSKIMMAAQRYAEAEQLSAIYAELCQRMQPPNHFAVAMSLRLLADTQNAQGRDAEAIGNYEKALSEYRSVPGDNPFVANLLQRLTEVLLRQKRVAEAEQIATELVELRQRSFAPDSEQVGDARRVQSLCHVAGGRQNEGVATLRELVAIFRAKTPPAPRPLIRMLTSLGTAFQSTGALPEAEQALREALTLRRAESDDRKPEIVRIARTLAEVVAAQGRQAEADELRKEFAPPASAPVTNQGR